jgi:acyl-CoA reductase-like NAD-dependent aldehyde dehydrogenase
VDALVQEAVSKGAKVLAGGKKNAAFESGRFYEPTLLVNVTHDMDVVKKECFGPVMTVLRFETTEELLQGVNSSDFALGASVFTTDYAKADRVSRAIGSGMVSINEWGMSALVSSLPFGGKGLSGFGRFAGEEGSEKLFCFVLSCLKEKKFTRSS